MNVKALNKKYNNAYQALVNIVENLVVMESKNLQQALQSGEEVLSECEWAEFSEEEVQDISSELKRDLLNLNTCLNNGDTFYKDEFKQHAPFVTDSLLDQLLNILNKDGVKLFIV